MIERYLKAFDEENLNLLNSILREHNDLLGNAEAGGEVLGGGDATVEAWQPVTHFQNGWSNYVAGIYNPAGYFCDDNEVIHLRGTVRSGLIAQKIFTIPVGYRPAFEEMFPVVSNNLFGACRITSTGSVIAHAGSNVLFSLDGITFRKV